MNFGQGMYPLQLILWRETATSWHEMPCERLHFLCCHLTTVRKITNLYLYLDSGCTLYILLKVCEL